MQSATNDKNMYLSTTDAAEHFGVCAATLRRWAATGKIKVTRTPGGNYRYWVIASTEQVPSKPQLESLLSSKEVGGDVDSRIDIVYARVSSEGQHSDLEYQIEYLTGAFPMAKVVYETGSCIGFDREGIQTVLDTVCAGRCRRLIVAGRDRISRFSYPIFEWICRRYGTDIVVYNPTITTISTSGAEERRPTWRSQRDETVDDLMTVIRALEIGLESTPSATGMLTIANQS